MPSTNSSQLIELIDLLIDGSLKPAEIKLVLLIYRLSIIANNDTWTPPTKVEVLAEHLGDLGMSTVSTAITNLRNYGLIEGEREGNGPNRYRICLTSLEKEPQPIKRGKRSRRKIMMSKS